MCLQIAVKYCIIVYLHAENDCGRPMFGPCRTFVDPVAKYFTSENGGMYSVLDGSLHRSIGHSVSAYRILHTVWLVNGYHKIH